MRFMVHVQGDNAYTRSLAVLLNFMSINKAKLFLLLRMWKKRLNNLVLKFCQANLFLSKIIAKLSQFVESWKCAEKPLEENFQRYIIYNFPFLIIYMQGSSNLFPRIA